MKTIMLIGGMGSGKSTVARMFGDLGALVIDLDLVGHAVLDDPAVASALVARFGEDVLDGGSVSRPLLARAAFESSESAKRLSQITHPAIVRSALGMLDDALREGCPAVVLEVSAFTGPEGAFEPLLERCSAIVAVAAREDLRVARAIARGFSEDDVRNRIARQPTDAQRAVWADTVLRNDGNENDLALKVESLWDAYFG
ncbi:MAG: dephospho-CoA kinase [Eggerthellaceae bacterium]